MRSGVPKSVGLIVLVLIFAYTLTSTIVTSDRLQKCKRDLAKEKQPQISEKPVQTNSYPDTATITTDGCVVVKSKLDTKIIANNSVIQCYHPQTDTKLVLAAGQIESTLLSPNNKYLATQEQVGSSDDTSWHKVSVFDKHGQVAESVYKSQVNYGVLSGLYFTEDSNYLYFVTDTDLVKLDLLSGNHVITDISNLKLFLGWYVFFGLVDNYLFYGEVEKTVSSNRVYLKNYASKLYKMHVGTLETELVEDGTNIVITNLQLIGNRYLIYKTGADGDTHERLAILDLETKDINRFEDIQGTVGLYALDENNLITSSNDANENTIFYHFHNGTLSKIHTPLFEGVFRPCCFSRPNKVLFYAVVFRSRKSHMALSELDITDNSTKAYSLDIGNLTYTNPGDTVVDQVQLVGFLK